ncbi:6-phosphogluconolactonase [Nocardioides seonyuensis]|uniref:6-phosphogluconolactonase n=1 Tax=Nocardioides seonyuensis TaxID=2518371 RepID=A0A4P7ILU7_9ACTN|nr:6-phosphogluconolactonase [Nocardioides seonyuensis]QBX57161.1 6-phosphogluconolactonase [Nocardioides seonyuensis]
MNLDIRRHGDTGTLAGDLASALLARLEEAQARGEVPHVGLTGGSISEDVHREVARRATESAVDWSQVVFWWGDERFLPADSPDRNALQARQALLDHLPVDPANVHEVPASDAVASAEDAAASYSETMRSQGAGFFEVLMLGMGPDGHIASLFPGHPAVDAVDEIAVAVHDSPKPPPDRVSLTFEAMDRARAVWFMVSGEGKADAVAAALEVSDRLPTPEEIRAVPARGVRGQVETVWWLDEAAAARL